MKIAIISDIHDNLANLEKCLDICRAERIETLLCCGDVTNRETLKFLSDNFKKKICLVRGNADIFTDEEASNYKNIEYLGLAGRVVLGNKNIGLCHEPFLEKYVLKNGACDMIFYGHTHKPWIDKRFSFSFVNPGTLGGVFQAATFALWDSYHEEPELRMLWQ